MSAMKDRLNSDMKEAMKAKENFKRDTIRLIMSAIKQIEVDERKELTDEDIMNVLKKAVKQREEALTQYKDAGRDDLAEKEQGEIDIIKVYLPEQLSDEALEVEVKKIVEEVGATTIKDMGKVMGVASKKLGSVADGKRINELVKKILG